MLYVAYEQYVKQKNLTSKICLQIKKAIIFSIVCCVLN